MSVIFAWQVPSNLWQILNYYGNALTGSPACQITCESKIVSFGSLSGVLIHKVALIKFS